MSVREIIRRFAQGLPVTGQRTPLYETDPEPDPERESIVDPRTMDLSEIEDELQRITDSLSRARKEAAENERRAKTAANNVSDSNVPAPAQQGQNP